MVDCRMKIPGYITKALICMVFSLFILLVLFNQNSSMDNSGMYSRIAYASIQRIYDDAGLLTEEDIEELEALSLEAQEESGIEIFILTHNDSDAAYPEKYIEDFEDQLPEADRVYFLYDVYNAEIFMEGFGLAETYIHSKRIDKIFDAMVDDLRAKNYFNAFETYITQAAAYMKDDSDLNYNHDYSYDNPPDGFDTDNEYSYDDYDYNRHYSRYELQNSILTNFWFQLIAALAIGAITVGIMAHNSGGKMTAGSSDYLDRSRNGLIGRRDQYIRTSVSKRRKPTQSSSGGGFKSGGFNSSGHRGGRSSGGRSHSSGGRKL